MGCAGSRRCLASYIWLCVLGPWEVYFLFSFVIMIIYGTEYLMVVHLSTFECVRGERRERQKRWGERKTERGGEEGREREGGRGGKERG